MPEFVQPAAPKPYATIRFRVEAAADLEALATATGQTLTPKGLLSNAESNSDTEGRLRMALSLREQHPDVVKVVRRCKRWHHRVDYSGFKNNQLHQIDCAGSQQ